MGLLTLVTVLVVGIGAAQGLRVMKASKAARTAGWTIILIAVFWVWYMVAADYGYSAVSGTYTLRREGESSTLVLRHDRSFQQELSRAGKRVRAQGTWRRSGEGGIAFSREFLKLSGQEIADDGEAYGHVEKSFLGLRLSIAFEPDKGGPRLPRKMGWLN
jgi:hypothetical protein